MAWITHYDLELYQIDVKIAFLNGNLEKEVYMDQPKELYVKENEHMVCKFKKSIYRLKQDSDNGILSIMIQLLSLVLRKILLIGVYI